jgi:hypothetical protein
MKGEKKSRRERGRREESKGGEEVRRGCQEGIDSWGADDDAVDGNGMGRRRTESLNGWRLGVGAGTGDSPIGGGRSRDARCDGASSWRAFDIDKWTVFLNQLCVKVDICLCNDIC